MRNICARLPIAFLLAAMFGVFSPGAVSAAEPQVADENESGAVIDIPGLGPIPIPLPPGSRVFGPGGPAPQTPQIRPRPPDDEVRIIGPLGLDELFGKLAETEDNDEAQSLAKSIRRIWARSGSDTADLLAERARLAEELGNRDLAKELLDYTVTLEPRWAEALVRRAKVRAALGDADGALSDLGVAVRLETRRFDAFAAIGALEESKGRKKSALEAYRRSLQIDPRQDDIRSAEERLRSEVEGRDI